MLNLIHSFYCPPPTPLRYAGNDGLLENQPL
jgi:hypothetical protein